jgi:DNA-binding GntR family transcriptional regulator
VGELPSGYRVFPLIADRLRMRITSGRYPAGGYLPSEAELCAEFRVARNTVRRALGVLEEDGLIATIPSKGRLVRHRDDPAVAVPYLYAAIAAELRDRIRSGVLAVGAMLPSETDLRRRHGASRNTVRQAFTLLEREGLIITKQGKGRFVRDH